MKKDAYNLVINDDGTLTLKIFLEDDVLDIEGKNGNLVIASAWDEEDEPERMTLEDNLAATKGWLTDWEVDEATAEAVCKELTPWFEKYSLSETEKIEQTIAKIEKMIAYRRVGIERKMANIEADNRLIIEAKQRIEAEAKKAAELEADIKKYEKTIAELKAHL